MVAKPCNMSFKLGHMGLIRVDGLNK